MSWRRSIACVVPITLLASALVLIEAPPVASQEPVAKKEVTLEESAAEAKRLGRLALCAGTEGKERESCLVACGDGWPLLEKCADWRRFGDVGFKLLQKAKKGDDAKALEASAIKAGMAPEEARHLRWYASLEYNLLDPDLLPKVDMADQVMAKNIDGLLYGPSEFEVSAGLHQTGRYKKSADIYAMIFKLLKDELGENHYRTVRVASKAGKYAWYAGDEMKALEYMGAASRGANAIFPEGHPWRAEANLYHQAILHIIEPGPKTSLDVLEQAQRRINATYGQDHLRATRAQMLFGRALAARGEIPRDPVDATYALGRCAVHRTGVPRVRQRRLAQWRGLVGEDGFEQGADLVGALPRTGSCRAAALSPRQRQGLPPLGAAMDG